MKKRTAIISLLLVLFGQILVYAHPLKTSTDTIPTMLHGTFMDDYGIRYSINDTLWTQLPNVKYHIICCNIREQYLLARNDSTNPSEKGLYTRIDYMTFSNMRPFEWGFCLTVYNAKTIEEAQAKLNTDRQNPKNGCSGYPFSRMKILIH